MNIIEIISKKRDGGALDEAEIRFVVEGVTNGTLPDYQVSAWLMAVFLRGMSGEETLAMTLAMRDSGERVNLSDLRNGPALDKHSTGGVGDKTTLVVVPILAAAGVPMLKMSGRGLGFSGGTIDKLDSIKGFRSDLTIARAKAQVLRVGAALIGQSATLAPADKALYALRDVTSTVESVPLIAGSIMSKKLASGGERIVLDVKVGSGAFMKTREQARTLARELVRIGNASGVPTYALLTGMEEPLGRMVGNALEVREAVRTLQNDPDTEPRFRSLCVELAAHGLLAVGKAQSEVEGRERAEELLVSGRGAAKFAEIIHAQGGPSTCDKILDSLPVAPVHYEVMARHKGFITGLDAETVGRLSVQMGAGRQTKTDAIDLAVGVELEVKTGDAVQAGMSLATLHTAQKDAARVQEWAEILNSAYTYSETPPDVSASLVLEVIA